MGRTIKTGVNWSLDGSVIDLFGAKGVKYSETSWGINGFLGDIMVKVSPKFLSADLSAIIAGDRRDGNEDKIAYIGVDARRAVCLYLEGILTLAALEQSEETPESITAKIILDGQERKLVITANLAVNMATYDAKGEIV